jgi:formate C-acetyltransferase
MTVNASATNSVAASLTEPLYSDRIARMREEWMGATQERDIERARYFTKAYQETEGMEPCMRAALGLKKTLDYMAIRIEEDDTIVGIKTFKKIAELMAVERTSNRSRKEKNTILTEHAKRFDGLLSADYIKGLRNTPDDQIKEIREKIRPYWQGRNMRDRLENLWIEQGFMDRDDPYPKPVTIMDMQGHVPIGMEKVVTLGFKGIYNQASEKLKNLKTTDPDAYEKQKDFLESVQVAARAVRDYANRYAALARKMAFQAAEPRKSELLVIAARCDRVPWEPPTTFMEALQAIWMTQIVMQISYGEDPAIAPGRVDQYLSPFYQADVAAGRMTHEQALEAMEEYLIKLATFTIAGPNNVTIGGIDKQGDDAVNPVTIMIMDALYRIKGLRAGLAVRVSEKSSKDYLLKACEVHRRTAGIAFYNDEKIVEDLLKDGYSREDARDYTICGCVEIAGTGTSNGYASGSGINIHSVIEMALNEGCRYVNNWQIAGIKTPPASTFKTFEDVKKAYADQLAYVVELMVKMTDIKDQLFAESFPCPLLSSTIEGCIESGKDITRGGARYNHSSVTAEGIATGTNCLAAIQWVVFEEKLVTMEELVGHLRNNFEGAEELRQQLLNKAPKYGNNDPKADDIALWIASIFDKEARKHKRPIDGGTYRGVLVTSGGQVRHALNLGATPDGRLSGDPVSNGIAPANSTCTEGLTATLLSAAKVCEPSLSAGTSLTLNFNPATIKTDEGLNKFAAMIEAYMNLGGRQVQFNPLSRDTLVDAQKNPGAYQDLMVKVSGYSFRFIDLSKSLQDDILNRSEFTI